MNENQQFEEAFGEELPTDSSGKSEAALMRGQEADEFEEGWGMFPDGDADQGVETAPVRAGSVASADLKPIPDAGGGSTAATSQPKNFNGAFAQARGAGLSTFEWNGKQYNTQTKEEAAGRKKATTKVLSEDEADALQLKPASVAAPAKPNHNSPSNVWPNNQPAKNIYANVGPSTSASPQTQAARAKLAENLKGKTSMADVMKGAR